MTERDPEFLPEEWTLYGVGAAVLLLRFAIRLKTVGLKGFQGDDYMSILVLALFTIDAATVHIIYHTGTNVEASALQQIRPLTSNEIATYEYGSKEQLAAWYSYTALIWAMKGTMLFFFNRLTIGLWQHLYVKWLAVACALSYVAVVLTLTFWCFPTQKNWQVVPDPGQKCTLKIQNFLVTVVLNVLTDAAILAVPLPLLWKLKVPCRKKLIVATLLCSGLFVICAAIVRVVLTLGSHPSAINLNRWGVRETIVGIIAINLPILKPMLNKTFWSKESFKSSSISHGTSRNLERRGPYEMTSSLSQKGREWDTEAAMGHQKSSSNTSKSEESLRSMGAGSEDFIIDGNKAEGVTVSTTYQVTSEYIEKDEYENSWQYGGMGGGTSKACVDTHPVGE